MAFLSIFLISKKRRSTGWGLIWGVGPVFWGLGVWKYLEYNLDKHLKQLGIIQFYGLDENMIIEKKKINKNKENIKKNSILEENEE